MSIKLIGAGGVETEVDANGSVQTSFFTGGGLPLHADPSGVFYWGFCAPVWAFSAGVGEAGKGFLINQGPRDIYIRRIMLRAGFNGTETTSLAAWNIIRARVTHPVTAVSAPSQFPIPSKKLMHAPDGYVFGTGNQSTSGLPIAYYNWYPQDRILTYLMPRRLNHGGCSFVLKFRGHNRIHLAPHEGLGLIHTEVPVSSDFTQGSITWEES